MNIEKFDQLKPEIQNLKCFNEILMAFLETSKQHKGVTKERYLSEMSSSMQLVSQVVKLYNEAHLQKESNYAVLCSKLQLESHLLKQRKSPNDVELYKTLLSLIDTPLIDDNLTIQLSLNDLSLYLASANNEESMYPKTKILCDILVT